LKLLQDQDCEGMCESVFLFRLVLLNLDNRNICMIPIAAFCTNVFDNINYNAGDLCEIIRLCDLR